MTKFETPTYKQPYIFPAHLSILEYSEIEIDYTNYKGERGLRRIEPRYISYGSTEFHKERQYLLTAYEEEKSAERTFAVKDIHSWKGVISHE